MLPFLAVALFAQTSISVGTGHPKNADSVAATMEQRRDSLRARRAHHDSLANARRKEQKIAVTPELLASAFRDAEARDLLARARAARLRQDSSLIGYDAQAYERLSIGMGIGRIGRDHLLLRSERASHVLWNRDQGAVVEVTGQRTASPILSGVGTGGVDFGGDEQVPYFPGRESMWIGSGMAKADVSDQDIIHPLGNGSEAYYTFASGDSVEFRLAEGSSIKLKELLVRPRRPHWNVAVGSLWFDASSGQLVRAVYRLAVPMDIWAVAQEESDTSEDDEVPKWVKGLVSPVLANVSAVTVEYGLHEGRFWLPRAQSVEGSAQVSFMHIPFRIEQSYRYSSVNGTDPFPAFTVSVADTATDSVSRAARRATRKEACKTGSELVRTRRNEELGMNVMVRVPCDSLALAHSPDLPKSIYDDGEELFGASDRDALIRAALDLGAQADFAPQRPTFRYGLSLTRYNRIEGLSSGIGADQELGAGYSAHATVRMGVADLSPNGELSMERSNGRRTIGVGVYRRLAVASDLSDPLGFSSSLSALFFGRDEGFYYRAWGAEMTLSSEAGNAGDWRLFAEQEFNAVPQTGFSLANPGGLKSLVPNIEAVKGSVIGLSTEHHASTGLDPRAFRTLTDLKAEAAAGDFDYARASLETTLSRGLGNLLDAALTLGGGTSGGAPPIQRQWFLGGVRTVRGQRAGAAIGDAFWISSLELGTQSAGIRKIVFGDLGWAGDRHDFAHPGRPLSGAGVGASFLDGLVRFDVAKGIYPEKKIRANLYVEARF